MTALSTRDKGQALVLFVLSIIGIVALMGLIVDGGFLYVQRRTAQTSADAGAKSDFRVCSNVAVMVTPCRARNAGPNQQSIASHIAHAATRHEHKRSLHSSQ